MKQVYYYSLMWKLVLRLLMIGLIVTFMLWIAVPVFYMPVHKDFVYVLPFSLLFSSLCIWEILALDKKWMIDQKCIRQISLFTSRELPLGNIRGYRLRRDNIYLVPYRGKGREIRISRYVVGCSTLMLWIMTHYKDLDFMGSERMKPLHPVADSYIDKYL